MADAGRADLALRSEGIAWLEVSAPETSGRLTIDSLRRMDAALERVEALASNGGTRVLVLATPPGQPDLTGYDPDELRALSSEDLVAWSHEAQVILRRLEELPIPTLAAIEGDWLGAGAELALACSYRAAPSIGRARVGFDQIEFGFLPAWGGTVRLPRLIGLQEALRLVLSGEPIEASDAVEIGLIDRTLPASEFRAEIDRYALRRVEHGRPRARRQRRLRRRLLDETAPGLRLLAARGGRRHAQQASAARAARLTLELMIETVHLPVERAFARESGLAGELILSQEMRGLLHSHQVIEAARAGASAGGAEVESSAVLGAGLAASDFAHLLVSAGIDVKIKDASGEAVRRGVDRARSRLTWERKQGRISDSAEMSRVERLEGVTGFGGFGTVDLVIAAPDTESGGASELLRAAEAHVRGDCILAIYAHRDSPTAVQRELREPARVIGLAPSFPADRFPLLEIAPGAQTSSATVGSARKLARRLSLTPVLVSDRTPTPGNRLLGVYVAEASRLMAEGATISQVDGALEDFGFAVGPFRRVDAIGSRRVAGLLEQLAEVLGPRVRPSPLFGRIARDDETFYRYRAGIPAAPQSSLPAGLSPGGPVVDALIRRRILLLLINEAAGIVESRAVGDPGDVDVVSIFGLGFPRQRGGLLFHAVEVGLQSVVDDLMGAAAKFGERYAPASLLCELATAKRSFFSSATEP